MGREKGKVRTENKREENQKAKSQILQRNKKKIEKDYFEKQTISNSDNEINVFKTETEIYYCFLQCIGYGGLILCRHKAMFATAQDAQKYCSLLKRSKETKI